MKIFVNNQEITLTEGMTVRHAVTTLVGSHSDFSDWVVRDQWGNTIGLDGALREGESITAEKV